MYADYKVEKGRKDHWAPYPAPDEIPVVREPLQWHAGLWGHLPPVDDSKILDVWHEVTYARSARGDEELLEELRWGRSVEKFVSH